MQLYYSHIAASSSPMYGGGPRWGTNDLALKRTEVGDRRLRTELTEVRAALVRYSLSPIPAFPREAGEGDAAIFGEGDAAVFGQGDAAACGEH